MAEQRAAYLAQKNRWQPPDAVAGQPLGGAVPPVAAVAPAIHPSRAAIIGSAPIVPMPMDTASASASLRPPTSGANALPFVASGANAAPAVRPTAAVPVTTGHTPIVVADAGGLTWAHVNQQQQQDRIHSVFIKHPPGYSKDELERVFDYVGPSFYRWRPNVDPSTQQVKLFGFADYRKVEDVSRVMTILGGLELNDRTTGERKPLVVKTDRQLTAMLEVYHRENQTVGQEEVERARGKVFEILGYAETTSKKEKEVGDFLDTVLAGGDGDVMSGTTMPAKTRDEESTVAAGDKPLMDRFHRADAVEKRPSSAMPITSLEAEEEREKRELEQIKLDREKAFVDRLRNWENREMRQARFREETERRDRDLAERTEIARKTLSTLFANYDDEREDREGKDEWFSDRQRWVEKRRYLLRNETEQDERDRAREVREAERERRRLEEEQERRRAGDLAAAANGHEDENAARRRSRSRDRARKVPTSSMRAVDFRKQLHDLLRSTLTFLDPLSKANMDTTALFAHKIDWALLDDTSIDRKLRPLIDTKLESFLGAKEPELVDFILEAVLPKKDAAHDVVEPGVVLEEILVAFGEGEEERREAEAMVADVWRTVVWETEKARVADGREITGLEKPIEELEVAEVL